MSISLDHKMENCDTCSDIAKYFCSCNKVLKLCNTCHSDHKRVSQGPHYKIELDELEPVDILKINVKRAQEAKVLLNKRASIMIKKILNEIAELFNKIKPFNPFFERLNEEDLKRMMKNDFKVQGNDLESFENVIKNYISLSINGKIVNSSLFTTEDSKNPLPAVNERNEEWQKVLNDTNKEKNDLFDKNQELKKKIQKLKENIKILCEEKNDILDEKNKMTQFYLDEKEEKSLIKNEKQEIFQQLIEEMQKSKKIVDENNKIKQGFQVLSINQSKLDEENKTLKVQIQGLTKKIFDFEGIQSNINQLINNLEQEKNILTQDLKQKTNELNAKTKDLEEEKLAFNKKLTELTEKLKSFQNENNLASYTIKELKEKIISLQKENE